MATLTDHHPDLVVLSNELLEYTLAVEVKAGEVWDLDRTESRLGEFMEQVNCPVGLIITPKRILVYRNTYQEPTLKRIGEFQYEPDRYDWHAALSGPPGQERVYLFERAVQDWLDGLVNPGEWALLPQELRECFEQYVIPALLQGELRVTGPRSELLKKALH